MTDFAVLLGSFTVGCVVAGAIVGGILGRLVGRLRARSELERTTADLENRRAAHDSGRTHKTRAQAGPPARIVDAMPAHRSHSKTSKKKVR